VQVDPRRVELTGERERELSAGGDVTREALLGEQPIDRCARKRLGGEQHIPVLVARRETVPECPCTLADVLFDDDVGGRTELPCELDGVAPTERQPAARVDPRADGSDVGELGDGGRHGRHDMRTAPALRP
jgi:hypothetical protein